MGFCTPQEHALFLRQTPIFEQMLIDDGIILRKYWFSVSDEEQLRRFRSRRSDPVRQWKLSPMEAISTPSSVSCLQIDSTPQRRPSGPSRWP